ncbi:MAG: hypothetical protein KFW07_03090 [Mycoplasmataceae bacterium]|nr:hypothetical protein [Mycoplasmataceae bacterium]
MWFVDKPILPKEWECGIIRFKDLKVVKKNWKPTYQMMNIKKQSIKKIRDKIKSDDDKRTKGEEIKKLEKRIDKSEEQYNQFSELAFDDWINLKEESENIKILKDKLSKIKLELNDIN